MPEFDALMLSRIQFAFTVGYHIIFPSMSIGLAQYLLFLRFNEYRLSGSASERYKESYNFWSRIFALSFGMGVVSGVVLSYEIGTNWGRFSEMAGPIVGPLMSFEVMTAFFLEAGFLGIMLLGRNRVPPGLHLFATAMVALGTSISAFWILSANSWMHTPAGYEIVGDALHPADWLAAIFNPSFPYRYFHMVVAALLATCFLVASVGAWFVLNHEVREGDREFGLRNLRNALFTAALLAPLQIFIGDLHGLNTLEHQPMKVAAMEGHWDTGGNVPLLLFALPNEEEGKNDFEIGIPNLTSFILTRTWDGEVPGLNSVPAEDRPPVLPVFISFRVMVGCGLLMLALAWLGSLQLLRKKLRSTRWLLQALKYSAPLGFIAILAGWITTEVGRQPWVVYGLIRTKDAATLLPTADVLFTLSLFIVVYSILFYAFFRFFRYLVRKGPAGPMQPSDTQMGTKISSGKPAMLTEDEEAL